MLASIVIRTLNEANYLGDLLEGIEHQATSGLKWEVIIVDSGSTDGTLELAKAHECRIIHISRDEFSFGRSLNIGCEEAKGDLLVLISGHCVPADNSWLQTLCQPLLTDKADYSYGRQLCGPESYYSECRIYAKYFPEQSRIPQDGFYCNNANAALSRIIWQRFHFDEELTGLEDMELALRITKQEGRIAYVADAAVFHYHTESWQTIEYRFEREALALQGILPHVQIRKRDLLRYILTSVWMDWRSAWNDGVFISKSMEIILYRIRQYWGSYIGNNNQRKLSHSDKEVYFYPSSAPSLTPPQRACNQGKSSSLTIDSSQDVVGKQ